MISKSIWDVKTLFNKVEQLNILKILIFLSGDIYILLSILNLSVTCHLNIEVMSLFASKVQTTCHWWKIQQSFAKLQYFYY